MTDKLKELDLKLLTQVVSITLAAGVIWGTVKGLPEQVELLSQDVRRFNETSIRQESQFAKIQDNTSELRAQRETLTALQRELISLSNVQTAHAERLAALAVGTADRLTGTQFERWLLAFERANNAAGITVPPRAKD